MNCKDFESLVLGLDRGESPSELVLEHAASCTGCNARLEAMQDLRGALRALAAQDELVQAPVHVEAALLEILRGSPKPVSLDLPATPFLRVPKLRLALAAAAALILIVIAGSIIYTRSDNRIPTVAGHTPGESIPADPGNPKVGPEESAPNRDAGGPGHDGGTAQPGQQKRDRPNQLAVYREPARNKSIKGRGANRPDRTDGYEIATDYFPISLGSYLQPLDGGSVVRIKLPRSALGNYGLPVDPLRADEAVKADVVIGNDGMARAIRFVH